MARRKFDRDYKLAAVKLIIEDEMDIQEVSQQLDIHPNSLYRWVGEYEKFGDTAFPGNGCQIFDYQAEIHRLERKNKQLEDELELLKKFQVFLKQKRK